MRDDHRTDNRQNSGVTISEVMRTRSSASRRQSTLRHTQSRWASSRTGSPLTACGDVFEANIRRIEQEYETILNRIDNATVIL